MRRRKSNDMGIIPIFLIVSLLSATSLIGFVVWKISNGAYIPIIWPERPSSEQVAVRKWLKENLPQDKWEEVKWSHVVDYGDNVKKAIAVTSETIKRLNAKLAKAQKALDDARYRNSEPEMGNVRRVRDAIDEAQSTLRKLQRVPPGDRFIRLKYRTSEIFGMKRIADDVFFLDGDRVTYVQSDLPEILDRQ